MTATEPLCEELVEAKLKTHVFGQRLVLLQQAGSTNDVARELAADGAPEGTVVVADEQTEGRGRLGRKWVAPPGECLLCSVLFRPNLLVSRTNWLTMLTALAMADAVAEVAGLKAELKWPNDLVVPVLADAAGESRWRKLAGVLTETAIVGDRLAHAIVGIGVNVTVPRGRLNALAPEATSILAEVGRLVSRVDLLVTFLAEVERRYTMLQSGSSPHREWASRLATLGRRVETSGPGGLLVGLAEGVDEDGALLLRTDDGVQHRLAVGDVTLSRHSSGIR
ncbi:MAG: biotin--[acetyl-CoA-carboxylase] ligase [Anaerolineae bacterium]|nr:biotin--[acetyl-CoA-carboxylase] ligase [Anaerolineae bacterium]